MRRSLVILFAAVVTSVATAQKPIIIPSSHSGADEVVENLWNNSTAPHSNGITADESINEKYELTEISQTDLYIYKADPAVATGQAVVVVPGGGNRKVCIEYDGFGVARYLRSIGITAIVVKYRLPYGHSQVPLEDIHESMRYVRANADKWGVDPTQVGILGSSAGGYLAALISTLTPDAEKPAFSILIYPVISGTTQSTHHGTFSYMLGSERTPAQQEYYSVENRVTPTTPPTLLLLADDDLTVPTISSTRYYKALKYHGVKASMIILPSGGHGWAGKEDYQYADPAKQAIADWLKIYRK